MRKTKFRKLGWLYITALLCIALSIFASQVLVQRYIGSQEDDSRVINVAGRQRMLSQKISKLVLKLPIKATDSLIFDLEKTLDLWVQSHEGLIEGSAELGLKGNNSEKVQQMFRDITPFYQTIVDNARLVTTTLKNESAVTDTIEHSIEEILAHEGRFLSGMDAIVFQYDHEAREKVALLKRTELILFLVSIAIILLEFIFIFRPTTRSVNETVEQLTRSEESSSQMAGEMSKLYDELVKSYQDLEDVKIEPESARVLANMSPEGYFHGPQNEITNTLGAPSDTTLISLMKENGYAEDFIEGLFKQIRQGGNWLGEMKFTDEDGDFVWFELHLIPITSQQHVKIVGRNITEVKEAKMISREINSEKIERKIKEQHYRSVHILEGQEEERHRLARELHDGVGQMLSVLKMSIESVHVPRDPIHNRRRFDDTKYLLKRVIQEIRRISFNLIPTNLADFGIVPAVKKLCQEVSKLSNITVEFENKTNFINRMEQHVESNLYRIVQEAINNSVKYSKAKQVKVIFEHSINHLKVTIEDAGKGFDLESLSSKGHFKSSGHGIFNMRERAAFIDAELEIETAVNQGTKIFVSLPIE
ncbi:MAG: histidine kinase [Bacteroidota bacterium]